MELHWYNLYVDIAASRTNLQMRIQLLGFTLTHWLTCALLMAWPCVAEKQQQFKLESECSQLSKEMKRSYVKAWFACLFIKVEKKKKSHGLLLCGFLGFFLFFFFWRSVRRGSQVRTLLCCCWRKIFVI